MQEYQHLQRTLRGRRVRGAQPGSIRLRTCTVAACVVLALVAIVHSNRWQSSSRAAAKAQQEAATQDEQRTAAQLTAELAETISGIFETNCFDCHSGESAEAGLNLATLTSVDAIDKHPERFEQVLKMVKAGAMPPADYATLSPQDQQSLIRWLNDSLDHVAASSSDPVKPTLRRLNRAEYDNTIRDLFGLDFSPAKDFPSDEVGHGFDNIGDVLSVSPLHLEKYLDAAETIAERAINAEAFAPYVKHFDADEFEGGSGGGLDRRGNFHMSRNGEVFVDGNLPVTAEYLIRVEASGDQAGDEPAKMKLTAAGKSLATLDVANRRTREFEVRCLLPGGESRVEAAFINDYYNPDAERNKDRNLRIRSIRIERAGDPDTSSLPIFHQELIKRRSEFETSQRIETAESARDVERLAKRLLRPFVDRAFRRPATDDQLDRIAEFVGRAVEQGASFERGMQFAVMAVLVSPHFLFHLDGEVTPESSDPARLDSYALASRLSYFLWSSLPDEKLFALAKSGELREPDILCQQAQRMLRDPRAAALVTNFAGQWLNLRRLDEIAPGDASVPGLDAELKLAMRTETEMFFAWIMREDRPIIDLLQADTTFVNQRLAEHYGLPGIEGVEFRQVSLSDSPRVGVLSQASILTITSNPTRTSPVKRGKWVMENILGDAPPDPPDDVPALNEVAEANPDLPLRKQLEIHRQNATCNSCHQLMDEIGFGFEEFGPLGERRLVDDLGRDVDATGQLPSGESFQGATQLVAILASQRRDDFHRAFTEQLFTYALGRGVTRRDRQTIDSILANSSRDDFRFQRIVLEIVTSQPFAGPAFPGGSP